MEGEGTQDGGWLRPYLETRFGGLDEQVKGLRSDVNALTERVGSLETARAEAAGEEKVRRGFWSWIADKATYLVAGIAGAVASHLFGH